MGKRGPLPGNSYGLRPGPKSTKSAPSTALRAVPGDLSAPGATNLAVPDPPADLTGAAADVWRMIVPAIPGLDVRLDQPALHRLCTMVAERDRWLASIEEHGPVLTEPIVTPTGAVVGERLVLNPAEGALRRLDRALDAASDRLGLSPTARGRLGLVVSQAREAAAASQAIVERLERL